MSLVRPSVVQERVRHVAAVDIETDDPMLEGWGNGAIRGVGEILTVAIYCPEYGLDGYWSWEDLLSDEEALACLADENIIKVFHNGLYDMNWLAEWGHLEVNGRIDDTLTREMLIDAHQFSYTLDDCCIRRGLPGKNKADTIDAWWANHGGKGKAIKNLKHIPVEIVGKYNAQDSLATYQLYQAQQPLIDRDELNEVNQLECDQIPWVMKCRHNGIRIDRKARAALSDRLSEEYDELLGAFHQKYGKVNYKSYLDMEQLFLKLDIPVVRSESGRASFALETLEELSHPIGQEVLRLRTLEKAINTYVDGNFVDLAYKGRLYPELIPSKRDDGGAVTGRYACRNPNIQAVSARAEKFGKEMRSLFLPEEGQILCAFDYKQIEYRLFAHFAVGQAGKDIQARYWKEEPDMHQMVQEMMGWVTGDPERDKDLRHLTKCLDFGVLYGLGAKSFAKKFRNILLATHKGCQPDELPSLCQDLINEQREKIPFITPTIDAIKQVAQRRGYVKTLSGRRQRVQPDGKRLYALTNHLVQGSAADTVKKAIADSWKKGVWNVLTPHLMVHDELVFSAPQTREGYEACVELADTMTHVYALKVPLGVDTEIGPDWGHCNESNWKQFESTFSQ